VDVIAAVGVGMVLGLKHAIEPDHVAAVATLLRREQGPVRAARVGAMWGLGHSVVLVTAAAALRFLGVAVPSRYAWFAELGVAAMLVLLGVFGVRRVLRGRHEHDHDHAHTINALEQTQTNLRALAVGAVHGLAGSSAAVLLAASANDTIGILPFTVLFGAGTVAGMSVATVLLGVVLGRASRSSERVHRALLLGASAVSVMVGLTLAAVLLRAGLR
jgi:nickel/cobalt exporter